MGRAFPAPGVHPRWREAACERRAAQRGSGRLGVAGSLFGAARLEPLENECLPNQLGYIGFFVAAKLGSNGRKQRVQQYG